MPYKNNPNNFLPNYRRNQDRDKGPAHVPVNAPQGQSRFRELLKKGWRKVGTPKEEYHGL